MKCGTPKGISLVVFDFGHLLAAGLAWACTLGFVRGILPERSPRWMEVASVVAGLLSALFVLAGLAGLAG